MKTKGRRAPYPKRVNYDYGPFTGMRDSLDSTSDDQSKASLFYNMYPRSPEIGGGSFGRPPYRVVTRGGIVGTPQGILRFTDSAGVAHRVVAILGELYEVNSGDEGITKVITTSDLASAGITLSPAARLSLCEFTGKLHVHDSENTPFLWSGLAGGGLTKLTGSPVLFGPVCVRSAKLVGIMATDRRTIVWSEEQDATIGYNLGGYNNAWDLVQTDQDPLVAVRATNDAIYYWRARSAGSIEGEIADEFRTQGTNEGISETIGTRSPWSPVVAGSDVFFIDSDGQPQMIRGGLGLVDGVWTDFRETATTVDLTLLEKAISVYYSPLGLVLLGFAARGQAEVASYFVYRIGADRTEAAAIWGGFEATALEMMEDSAGGAVLFHGSTLGHVYAHASPTSVISYYDEVEVDEETLVEQLFTSPFVGGDPSVEKMFDQFNLVLRSDTELDLEFRAETPRQVYDWRTLNQISSPGSVWGGVGVVDVFGRLIFGLRVFGARIFGSGDNAAESDDVLIWDDGNWALDTLELKKDFGTKIHGRWVRFSLRTTVVGQRLGFLRGRTFAELQTSRPGLR